jgi:hypothetical protein
MTTRNNQDDKAAMQALVDKHNLSFTNNPGGGEFILPEGVVRPNGRKTIQVFLMDSRDDLERLKIGLAEAGLL